MVSNQLSTVVRRFELAVRRPWAQTLQFALEQHPEADNAVNELLEQPDDAFNTVLRLITRCIINGAQVSEATRARVGDKLAEAWVSQSYSIQNRIGELLADGFTRLLPARVRSLLEQAWGLQVGGAEIIVRCNDQNLTLAVLEAWLAKDLEHQSILRDWQTAVDRIAGKALKLYVHRVKAEKTTVLEVEALAYLIAKLSPKDLPDGTVESIIRDQSLPPIVRLAGHILGPHPLSREAFTLVDAIVRQPEDDRQIIPAWYFGVTALWQLDDSSEIWLAYVTDESLSMDRREKFLFTLLDSPLSATDKVVRLDTLIKEQLPGLHYKALLLRAYALESPETMRQLASEWERLSLEEIQLWAAITGKYRAGDIIVGCFRKLQEMDLSDEWIVRIAQSLSFGMRYEVDLYSASSWAGRARILHPNTQECAEMIWAWSIRYRGNLKGRLKVLTAAGDLGHLAAIESLSQELISLINQNDDWFKDFDNDHIIANCLHTLSDQQQQLPPASSKPLCPSLYLECRQNRCTHARFLCYRRSFAGTHKPV